MKCSNVTLSKVEYKYLHLRTIRVYLHLRTTEYLKKYKRWHPQTMAGFVTLAALSTMYSLLKRNHYAAQT